jgi:heme o synthase
MPKVCERTNAGTGFSGVRPQNVGTHRSSVSKRLELDPVPQELAALRRVSLASTIFAFALVVWGAIVRIEQAGMTCPDWPRCRGVWIPALDNAVIYEWVHRLAAALLTLAIAGTSIAAWRARKQAPGALRAAWAALALIVAQIVAGALTIRFNNNPPTVALHLVVGFATFATLLLVTLLAYDAGARQSRTRASLAWLAVALAGLAFCAVFAGGYMSASYAGLACTGFPLCDGMRGAASPLQTLHMTHRYLAYATIAATAGVWAAAMLAQTSNAVRIAASVVFGLALVQGALGVLTIASGLSPILRSLHEANGALFVGAIVSLALVAFRGARAPSRDLAQPAAPPSTGPLTRALETVVNFAGLTKPNVMSLLLFTTLAAMVMAAGGLPTWQLLFFTLLGGALASASSAAINMYFDRDIDAEMKRTRARPIPSGRVKPRHALIFGIVLGVLAFVELFFAVNLLAAGLAAAGILYYVFVYTVWLKRTSPQNIVIGGAAGSIPPLVGWAAVTGHLGITAFALFLIVFIWTPPHFWALALMKTEEYARVGIPMMPAVYGDAVTKKHIFAYTIALTVLTLALVPLHLMGLVYLACALALDAVFFGFAIWVMRTGSKRSEGLMYRYSMLYLALLFAAMAIDRLGHGLSAS